MYGSIPACAGEPSPTRRAIQVCYRSEVYPRVCGGAFVSARAAGHLHERGLSPRVRGEPDVRRGGSTWRPPSGLSPRVRGSHLVSSVRRAPRLRGLSPRVRGSPVATLTPASRRHVGLSPRVRGSQPCRFPRWCVAKWVYPRVCGGAHGEYRSTSLHRSPGLSPRVRGSPSSRLCDDGWPMTGLSPRVRGSPVRGPGYGPRPAIWVYPRVCGGARNTGRPGPSVEPTGLSPRVRGSRLVVAVRHRRSAPAGSIPACAGEPLAYATV